MDVEEYRPTYTCFVLCEHHENGKRYLFEAPVFSNIARGTIAVSEDGQQMRVVNSIHINVETYADAVNFVIDATGAKLPLKKITSVIKPVELLGDWCDWSAFNKKQEADDEH